MNIKEKRLEKIKVFLDKGYKRLHLGLFKKEEDARQAYLDAKKIYHII